MFNHVLRNPSAAAGIDNLGGFHANTHIPEVMGDAAGYILTGNETKFAIADTFFRVLQEGHTWATGGSNDHEYWYAPKTLGDQLDDQTEESCSE